MSLFRRNSLPIPAPDEYPSHSILLNGSSPSPHLKLSHQHIEDTQGTPSSVQSTSTIPASPNGSLRSTQSSVQYPHSISSAKVSFAPLPIVPPELKRRNSITLGVAARANLLSQQGSAPPRVPGAGAGAGANRGNVVKVSMTDEEWEAYKKAFEEKNGADAVDLGELAKNGAKNLWRRVRSASTSSTTSNDSTTSNTTQTSEASNSVGGGSSSSRRLFGRGRTGSNSSLTRPMENSLGLGLNANAGELGTVHEEERISAPPSAQTSPQRPSLALPTGGSSSSESSGPGRRGSFDEWSHSRSPTKTTGTVLTDANTDVTSDHEVHHRRLASPPPSQSPLAEDENGEEEQSNVESPETESPPEESKRNSIESNRQKPNAESTRYLARDDIQPIHYRNSSAILGFDANSHARR